MTFTASMDAKTGMELSLKYERVSFLHFDVTADIEKLRELIQSHNIVVR